MIQFLQLIVSGIAVGCVLALIALGFTLIYKATETVNFAQGDLMMLGGFAAYTAIVLLGLPFCSARWRPSAAMASAPCSTGRCCAGCSGSRSSRSSC